MATNTAGTSAREYYTHQVHYLRKKIVYSDDGSAVTMGTLPAGSTVIDAGIVVTTAFNGAVTNTVDIGVTGTATAFAGAIATGTAGIIGADNLATTTLSYSAADIDAICTVVSTTGASAGEGYAYITYLRADGND